ncbi:hypothetical protein TanjilG_26601 [Lupinus angustifolius]|uniref:E3 ubiquitin-protein ligase RMA n=1 Tax=Lupinus angustifolius TaxID=3871 RepID=A0A4P1QQ69_LUPAN|nr:PREDICTED: E3 ubiquitin-protein ligase RMA1H1-like [Lupinus angustifolius]OIV91748.1 hypothetical protein TanjilG_26601 [Lupinus angustifolius]
MAFENYFSQECKSKSIPNAATETENYNGCFDCNICLDFAYEPIVTLCGHLYCWPCIYQWLHVQSNSLAPDEHPQCPVCKADISHTTVVPLYGRGQASIQSHRDEKSSTCDIFVPPRPSASVSRALLAASSQSAQQHPYRNPYQGHYEEAATSQMLNPGYQYQNPVVGMFGEMLFARVFGNSENSNAYPNSYQLMGSNSTRLRRREMLADKSLNRISIFVFCWFLLCLIVF